MAGTYTLVNFSASGVFAFTLGSNQRKAGLGYSHLGTGYLWRDRHYSGRAHGGGGIKSLAGTSHMGLHGSAI